LDILLVIIQEVPEQDERVCPLCEWYEEAINICNHIGAGIKKDHSIIENRDEAQYWNNEKTSKGNRYAFRVLRDSEESIGRRPRKKTQYKW
jgi:hypothetical protein